MSGKDRNLSCVFLAAIFFLGSCASDSEKMVSDDVLDGLAAPDSYIVTGEGVSTGAADIDPGLVLRDGAARSGKGRPDNALDRLGRILKPDVNLQGDDFDPNKVEAPDYDAPIYNSKVNKKRLLEDLMSSAYDAYKKVTGDKWYPRRAITGVESRDPLLNPRWWQVYAGQTLQGTLSKWGQRAGWRVVWKSSYEYPIEANAVFKGDFPKVVGRILSVFEKEHPRLQAVFYKNRVVVINNGANDKGEG